MTRKRTTISLSGPLKLKRLIRNSLAEEAAINRGIARDPDTYVMSDEQFERCKPVRFPGSKGRGG
jgi:hypothetical protein